MTRKRIGPTRRKFLAEVRKGLREERDRMLEELESESRAEREANKDEGQDTYDLASEERDREISVILSDRERRKIGQIEDALERLDAGDYGVCESCGLEIAEARLRAMPFTMLCRDCQQDLERQTRSERSLTRAARTYRKFGSTDSGEDTA